MVSVGRRDMSRPNRLVLPQRGEIYLVNFDPTVGSEIQKTRPAMILQNDIANKHSPITIVAAITSKFDDRLYPTEVLVLASNTGLSQDSVVLLNQIRSIDRTRLIRRLGVVSDEIMTAVDRAIQVSLGLIPLN
jgi:mRNA interferase MazF